MLNIFGISLSISKVVAISVFLILASNLYTGATNAISTVKNSNTHISR